MPKNIATPPAGGAAEGNERVRIVVVQDDPVAADIVRHRLRTEPFEVRVFADGAEAWGALQDDPSAALVILDVKLPGMDGFEILEQLRASAVHAGTPVLMLSALTDEDDVVRAFTLGADDYMAKPFSPAELRVRILRLLHPRT